MSVVRDVTSYFNGNRYVGQTIENLSDGSAVALVKDAINKLYLYHSADRVTWTLENTITLDADRASPYNIGMCVDDSDNVHIFYFADYSPDRFRYMKMTFSAGPSWSEGAEETISNETGTTVGAADITFLDSGAMAFAWVNDNGSADRKISYCIRSTAGSWTAATALALPDVGGIPGDIAICRDSGGATTNLQEFAIMGRTKAGETHIFIEEVNITTGAWSASYAIDSSAVSGTTSEQCDVGLFPYAAGEWCAVAIAGTGSSTFAWAARFDNTGYTVSATTKTLGFVSNDGGWRTRHVGYSNGRPFVIFYVDEGGPGTTDWIYGCVAQQTASAFTWGEVFLWKQWAELYSLHCLVGRVNDDQGNADFLSQVSYTDGFIEHWYNETPPAPTAISPSGASQNTDLPTLQATIARYYRSSNGEYSPNVKAEWDVARDSGFTTDNKNIRADTFITTGPSSKQVPLASRLDQDTWYVRALAEDAFGKRSSYIATASFAVAHPASTAGNTPSGGQAVEWAATNQLTWTFEDTNPGDAQTAYQVVVERDSDSLAIVDTGKVASSDLFYDLAVPGANKGQTLRWKVKVWDEDDVEGTYSDWFLFNARTAPTVAVTAPTATFDHPTPVVAWTYTAGAEGGAQAAWAVVVTDDADDSIVYSATASDASTSHEVSDVEALINGESYTFTVTVTDTNGLTATDDEAAVVATWTPPVQPEITGSDTSFESDGYIRITWDDTDEDADFLAWRVYRRYEGANGLTSWELLYETTDSVSSSFTYDDYTSPAGVEVEYVVVQVADVFGADVESIRTDHVYTVTPESANYWLIDEDDLALNFSFSQVVEDDFTEEQESTEINLIGRGRHVERGTVWGYRGTLTVHLRGSPDGTLTGRQQRHQIENMKRTNRLARLRNPFGDVWQVNLGDVQFSRMAGVGNREFNDVTIPYAEIS